MTGFDPSGPAIGGGLFGLPGRAEDAAVVIVPVPWEPTTSYRKGTVAGPENILAASRQVDLFDRELGKPYEAGIAMLPVDPRIVRLNSEASALAQPIIDAGGAGTDGALLASLEQVNRQSEELNAIVEEIAGEWLDRRRLVGLVGGDHSSPFGLLRALCRRNPGFGVLHIDAHADLRDAYEGFRHSHASIMHNVHERLPEVAAIVQVGIRDFSEEEHALAESSQRIQSFYDVDLATRTFSGEPFAKIAAEIVACLPAEVYVSFDIDGLDPSLCPSTGTPVPGGLTYREACALLSTLASSGRRIIGFDLNEVSGATEWDGIVGARVLYKLVGLALRSR